MFINFYFETEREIDMREKHQLVVSYTHPNQGSNLQPRCVPWPGTEPATLGVRDDAPTAGATRPGQEALFRERGPKSKASFPLCHGTSQASPSPRPATHNSEFTCSRPRSAIKVVRLVVSGLSLQTSISMEDHVRELLGWQWLLDKMSCWAHFWAGLQPRDPQATSQPTCPPRTNEQSAGRHWCFRRIAGSLGHNQGNLRDRLWEATVGRKEGGDPSLWKTWETFLPTLGQLQSLPPEEFRPCCGLQKWWSWQTWLPPSVRPTLPHPTTAPTPPSPPSPPSP